MKTSRRKFSAAFKAKVVIEAIKERETLAELSQRYDVHSNMISKWKKEFLERATEVFDSKPVSNPVENPDIDKLYTKIGRLEMERDFLKKVSEQLGINTSSK